MLLEVIKTVTETITIKPGDYILVKGRKNPLKIRKIIETSNRAYAVLSNRTWRPFSTYGVTWKKVD